MPKTQLNFLEEKATYLLKQHDIKKPYEIDLYKIINSYKNIKVIHLNQESKTIIKENKALIILNNQLSTREHRQQLAEELCHALLHLGNQVNNMNNLLLDKQEQQAQRMSAYLLCPLYILKNLDVCIDTYAMIEELAEIFQVTESFMQYRLNLIWGKDLRMITYHRGQAYGYMTLE